MSGKTTLTSPRIPEVTRGMTRSQALLTMVGTIVTLAILFAGVGVVFLQSYQDWGGLPPLGGPGLILYGGVIACFAVGVLLLLWSWRLWERSR